MTSSFREALEYINQYVEKIISEWNIPGMAVAVTDREKLLGVLTHGVTDGSAQSLVHSDTLFEIGSLGKPFTSIALLQLHDEGRLDLHAPVSEYLPWFQVQSDYGPITVHHLMNHTAGIVRGTDIAPHGLYESWALRQTGTCAPPGTYFSYSNIGYKTLGFLLEAVTGQSYQEIMRCRVLEPMGMTRTHPAIKLELRERAATGHCGLYDDRPEHPTHPVVPSIWAEYGTGDGCQMSNVEDLAVYLRMLLNRGMAGDTRIISEHSFNLMTLNGIWTGGDYYGYGLASYPLEGRTYIGHGGGNAGFRSAIVVDLEAGLGVVFLLNRMGETDPIVNAATHALTVVRGARLGEPLPEIPPLGPQTTLPNGPDYCGVYRSDRREIEFITEHGQLLLKHQDSRTVLERRGEDAFYAPQPDFDLFLLYFRRAEGRVVEMLYGPEWFVNPSYSGPDRFHYPEEWTSYCGHYRARNPELSNFRVIIRKGELALANPWGNVESLVPRGDGLFRVGADPQSPETLGFDTQVNGRALRAIYSGCPYYRAFTP